MSLTQSMIATAASNPPLHEFLLTQAQQQITYHSSQLSYWQSIHSQLSSDGLGLSAGVQPISNPTINPSMSPRTTHVNPKASFRDGLASVIGRKPSTDKTSFEDEYSPASSPSPKFAHADKPRMKRPTSRVKQTTPFVASPSNAQSSSPSNNQTVGQSQQEDELKFSANPLPPIPATSRSGTSSPQGSEPASPSHANITAAAARRPPPLPPSQQGSRAPSRTQSPRHSPIAVPFVAPAAVDIEEEATPVAVAAAATPVSAAARFGGIKMMPIAAVDPSIELKARLQKRADGTVPPPLLKVQSAAPTVSVETTTAACAHCGCKDFKQDAFKKSKCSNCFHVH